MKKYIAIDGPAGAGKSTVAQKLAQSLKYLYLDTGALYRAITLYFWENNIPLEDCKILTSVLSRIKLEVSWEEKFRIFLNGREVTEDIRQPEVDALVSPVAKIKEVRNYLCVVQREIALSRPSVTEGRDIGTVILPDADLKIFLTARPEIRAYRRWKERKDKGNNVDYKVVLKNVLERDFIDSTRDDAPLKKAEDAIEVDTSFLSVDEVVEKLYKLVEN
ncbi:MAG TPA: (d)CMP kinase [Candidatus Atribacteria bacterium]|jgi:cytidylate kinase|uniref:(d)CMP kinase n=1 Tax=Candidatus Sordicultor fermentans TaxID=1953203 RepID=UPI0016B6AFC9|nr:(d)CMP kinase [Atribacterota bacterium]NLY04740.1 (d)CMP kinase [Candidatus Atribacteria bacterium]MDI9607934.1 (d)CMP kinase [Atribacterota bacterium]HOA98415.1 (d)CMP kinase [Candidatus Atribacteria bacterium]HOQ50298.1 (d)CMP kinase [Candidatus Atribacteria bacterium]